MDVDAQGYIVYKDVMHIIRLVTFSYDVSKTESKIQKIFKQNHINITTEFITKGLLNDNL